MATVVQFDVRGAGKIPAALDKNAEAAKKLNKTLKDTGKNWKSNAAEAKKYDRLARQITRQNESAQERYNRKLRDAKKALAGNAREVELLAKEQTRLRVALLREIDGQKKLKGARTSAFEKAQAELKKLGTLTGKNTQLLGKQGGKVLVLKNRFGEAGKASEGAFGSKALGNLVAFGAGFLSIQKGIQAVIAEFRAAQELVDKSNNTQLSISESRNLVLRNTISQTPAERKRILAASSDLSSKTGVSETAINAGLAQALSASGGKVDSSLAAVEVAARFLADRPQDIGEAAGTLLDLSKVTGTSDAKTNLGLLTKVGELGRVVDPKAQAQNIAPALIGAQSFGGTARGAGALFAALTNAGADVQGRRTGTAEVQLAKQLSEFDFGLGGATKSNEQAQADVEVAESRVEDAKRALTRAQGSQSVAGSKAQLRLDRAVEDQELANKQARLKGKPSTRLGRLDSERRRIALERRVADARESLGAAGGSRVQDARETFNQEKLKLFGLTQKSGRSETDRAALANRVAGFKSLNLTERIQFLQNNPNLAKEFIGSASFESKTLGPIQDLILNPNSQAATEFSRNLSLIPGNEGLGKVGSDALGVFSANSLESVARRNRRIKVTGEQLRASDDLGSISSEEREIFRETLQRVGSSALGSTATDFLSGINDGGRGLTESSLLEQLQLIAGGLRNGEQSALGGLLTIPSVNGPNDEQLRQLDILQPLIDTLKANVQEREAGKDQVDEQKETNRLLSEIVAKPGFVGVPQ